MSHALKDIGLALLLGVVSNTIYTIAAQTINLWHILIIFVLAIIAYYAATLGLAKPFLVLRRGGIVNVFRDYAEARNIILTKLRHSGKIKITTIGGGTIFEVDWGEFCELLESKARGGVQVKVLVLNPDSRHLEARMQELAKFKPGKFNLSEFSARTRANVLKVSELNKLLGPCKIQLRYYDMLPTWRLYLFDDSIFISSFLEDKEGHDTTVYQVTAGSDLYRAFERCFDHMWDVGEIPSELKESAQ